VWSVVSVTGVIQALKSFLMDGAEDEGKRPAGRPSSAPKTYEETSHERCMVCGLETNYAEMMYENGYAVCFLCYKTMAMANYYGRVIWV